MTTTPSPEDSFDFSFDFPHFLAVEGNISSSDFSKIIFCYWNDFNTAEGVLVKEFLSNWQRKFPSIGWKIFVVSDVNLLQFVDENFIKKVDHFRKEGRHAHFADALRLELLVKYGGVWLDISTIIFRGNFLDSLVEEMEAGGFDTALYEYKEKTVDTRQPHLENWFIMAKKGSTLLRDWYEEFDRAILMGFEKYRDDVLSKTSVNLTNTIKAAGIYLTQHGTLNYVMIKNPGKYKLLVKHAEESFFKLYTMPNWYNKSIKFIHYLKTLGGEQIYAVKLISMVRREAIRQKEFFVKFLQEI